MSDCDRRIFVRERKYFIRPEKTVIRPETCFCTGFCGILN